MKQGVKEQVNIEKVLTAKVRPFYFWKKYYKIG